MPQITFHKSSDISHKLCPHLEAPHAVSGPSGQLLCQPPKICPVPVSTVATVMQDTKNQPSQSKASPDSFAVFTIHSYTCTCLCHPANQQVAVTSFFLFPQYLLQFPGPRHTWKSEPSRMMKAISNSN